MFFSSSRYRYVMLYTIVVRKDESSLYKARWIKKKKKKTTYKIPWNLSRTFRCASHTRKSVFTRPGMYINFAVAIYHHVRENTEEINTALASRHKVAFNKRTKSSFFLGGGGKEYLAWSWRYRSPYHGVMFARARNPWQHSHTWLNGKGYVRCPTMNMHERENDKIARISIALISQFLFSAQIAKEDAKHTLGVEKNEPLASICDV